MEVSVLKGRSSEVESFAEHVVAERGVRHGKLVMVPAPFVRPRLLSPWTKELSSCANQETAKNSRKINSITRHATVTQTR